MACRRIFYPFPNPYFRCGFIGRKPHPKSKFTAEEDAQLKELVDLYGDDWNLIANKMVSRNPRQCRDRYSNYLVPGFFNGQWSPQEDEILLQKYRLYGPKWSKIMKFLEGRSANAIKNRWYTYHQKVRARRPQISKSKPSPPTEPDRVAERTGDRGYLPTGLLPLLVTDQFLRVPEEVVVHRYM